MTFKRTYTYPYPPQVANLADVEVYLKKLYAALLHNDYSSEQVGGSTEWISDANGIHYPGVGLDRNVGIEMDSSATDDLSVDYLLNVISSTAAPTLKITNKSDSERDPTIKFYVGASPVVQYTMGVDDNEDNSFKISVGDALGTTDLLQFYGDTIVLGQDAYMGIADLISASVIIGYEAANVGDCYKDIVIGYQAAGTTDLGGADVIVGYQAAYNIATTGGNNVILGNNAANSTAGYWSSANDSRYAETSVLLGAGSGYRLSGASHDNAMVGYNAGLYSDEVSHSVFVGTDAGWGAVNAINTVVVGDTALDSYGSYLDVTVIGGNSDATQLIGTPTLAAASGAGLEIGEYRYIVTAIIGGQETPAKFSPTSCKVTTTAGNQKVNVTVPTYPVSAGLAGFTCTDRKIYRTKVDANQFYLLTTINDNSTTSYADTTADASLTDDYDGCGPAIVIGAGSTFSMARQMVFGDGDYYYTDVFFNGERHATPQGITINASSGKGTNIAGSSLTLAGGRASGNAAGGDIVFKTGTVGSSGTALQALAERFKIKAGTGGVIASVNVGIGTSTFGANSDMVLGILNGTPPAAHVDNEIQVYSKDSSDAAATLGLELEQLVEDIGTFTATNKIKVWINGVEYWIQLDAV